MNQPVTLMHPEVGEPTARAISSGLPADLLSQSARRLRILALLYAFIFFMAGIVPALLFPADRARFFGSFVQWGPGVIGIGVALLTAAVVRSDRFPLPTAMTLGLVFEIASSYAIAAAEFGDPMGIEMHRGYQGLSKVAVWVVLFTVVVPTSPRRALLAALASVSSVPGIIGLMMAGGLTSLRRTRRNSSSGWCSPTCSSWAWPMWEPAWSTSWAPRSSGRASWGATAWRRSWEREAWGRCGGPGIACWPGPPPSSSFGPPLPGMLEPECRKRQSADSSARPR